jgi:hypothetical protein
MNSRPDRARVWESATTVHEYVALQNTGCYVHGAKPNRNSQGRRDGASATQASAR